jgi:hypothetical protein
VSDLARPERIVDASAYCASLVPSVRAAFGCGASGITFPGGVVIAPIPSAGPYEPFTHTSELPGAPIVSDHSATVTEIEWRIPMRLYLPAADLAEARRQAAPFYGRYLAAFHAHAQLGGTANSARITSFAIGGDENANWLDMVLAAWQRLNLDSQPGEPWT